MGRNLLWTLGVGAALAVSASTASAQTRIDVGIFTPTVGGRVVIGEPRVVVAPPPRVVVVERHERYDYRRSSKYWRDREKAERKYYRDLEKARRNYEKNVRKAERRRYDW